RVWGALGAEACEVELEFRDVAGAKVRLLLITAVLLDNAGIGDGVAEEGDGVANRAAVVGVGVEVDVLALGELGDHDEWLQREGLIVNGVLVTRHLEREGAVRVFLAHSLLEGVDAEAEELVVVG